MKYADLTRGSRRRIWSAFVGQAGAKFAEEDLEELAGAELNGRQIKNAVKTAQLLALEDGRVLAKGHIDMVLGIEKGFWEDEE